MTLRRASQKRRDPCLRRAVGALYALLLLFGTSGLVLAADKDLTAILIVARGELTDPSFADSVVLVMNNLAAAPVGIIVNRPTPISVSQLFPDLKSASRLHDKVYFGGPVELDSVWFLFRAAKLPEHAIQAFDDIYLSADRDLLVRLLARDKPMDGLRIFVGHAGWAPGQLEAEIGRGAWTAERAESGAIFNGGPEHPWPSAPTPQHSI
jgi:putative transcriptional regulator